MNRCSVCNSTFKRIYDLRKHVKKFHKDSNVDEIAPLKEYNFSCDVCEKHFNDNRNLTYHKKKNHDESSENDGFSRGNKAMHCTLCNFEASFKTQMYGHFQEAHDIKVNSENLKFSTKREFEEWKVSTEHEAKAHFIKERGDIQSKSHKTISYICHRSGFYTSEGKEKRYLKTQGSRKIGGYCPASMKVTVDSVGQYQVTYTNTHIGHTADLGHLNLTPAERKQIAEKLALKIPFSDILDEVRDQISDDSLNRIHLLSRKDLNNIASAFNLQSKAVRHSNDAISVDAWVKDMKQNHCVLFYKPQDLTMKEHPELKSNDFVLIIMNEGQSQILSKFSSDCVCIDGTHGLNSYNFELHTLLVLDDLRQGFPSAFLISNRSDQEVIALFFSYIKERIGFAIKPKIFMSDMADAYYNAWRQVMEEPDLRLFCTWHIDRAWRKNLHLIHKKEKQVEIYRNIRTLLQETDETAFLAMLEQFLIKSFEDQDTSRFAAYFKENYEKNHKSWAYCYRLHCGINTNMHLERMHGTIKHIYLQGKRVKRLDKSINCIMMFVKDKLFDRIISLNKGKISSKLKDLRKRHKRSLELDMNKINKINDGWQVLSASTQNPEIYDIFENIEECDCQLRCYDCKICIHKYSCSCLDSAIRWNMCKHIHLLGRKLLDQENKPDGETPADRIREENDDLHVHIDHRFKESEDLVKSLSTSCSTDPKNETLSHQKDEIKRWFCSIVDSVESTSQLNIIKKIIGPIEPTLKAASVSLDKYTVLNEKVNMPHNTKIEPQRRLYSTKKKINNSNKLKKPSTDERNEIAISLLNNSAPTP